MVPGLPPCPRATPAGGWEPRFVCTYRPWEVVEQQKWGGCGLTLPGGHGGSRHTSHGPGIWDWTHHPPPVSPGYPTDCRRKKG